MGKEIPAMEIAPAVATVTEVIKVTMQGSRAGAQGSVPPWMVATIPHISLFSNDAVLA